MNPRSNSFDCRRAGKMIHARLDHETVEPSEAAWLEAHLQTCADCEGLQSDLGVLQDGLRSLPSEELPDAVLDEVWGRTVREGQAPHRQRSNLWRFSAAAALIVVAVTVGVTRWNPGPVESTPPGGVDVADEIEVSEMSDVSEEDARLAAAQLRLVLGTTSQALRRARTSVVKEVLVDQVAPALERVPLRLPGHPREPANEQSGRREIGA